tara:strand:- start:5050 stop:5844 length:795 start_codon:yes stop_codon:yes gene_type:complete
MIPHTKCNGCVFAKLDNSKQVGCELDRATKLNIQENDEDNFFVLSRFCNAYRPKEWLGELSVSESEDIKSTVMEEIYPRIGFFVLLDSDREDAIIQLEKTLKDIGEQQLITPRYIIVINDKVEYNEEIYSMLGNMFEYDETQYHIVQLQIKPENAANKIDEAFRHAKNGWAYVTSSGESVPRDLIYNIHKRINIDMKKLVVVKPYDNINGLLFQTALFKFVNGNKMKLYQDEMVDSRSFLEKVEAASLDSDDETFISWSEFNES